MYFIKIGVIKRYGVCLVSFKIVGRIRRQSSSASCELCSHRRRRRDKTVSSRRRTSSARRDSTVSSRRRRRCVLGFRLTYHNICLSARLMNEHDEDDVSHILSLLCRIYTLLLSFSSWLIFLHIYELNFFRYVRMNDKVANIEKQHGEVCSLHRCLCYLQGSPVFVFHVIFFLYFVINMLSSFLLFNCWLIWYCIDYSRF